MSPDPGRLPDDVAEAAANPSAGRQAARGAGTIGLGGWNMYFLAKFALVYRETIGFHALENLAFAMALLVPLADPRWQRLRRWVAVPVGIALLYYDSWLPPFSRVISQASLLASFSPVYLMELLSRFVNVQVVSLLVIAVAAYAILARWFRVGVFVMAGMVWLALPKWGDSAVSASTGTSASTAAASATAGPVTSSAAAGSSEALDQELKAFFADESRRSVAFKPVTGTDKPFDIIFLHVCSMSWDDIGAVGLENHRLWKKFDITLTRFNSAATYSGPAAIRFQRGACGQQEHTELYSPAPDGCYLMTGLKDAGFETQLALNHDGHFDNFLQFVQGQLKTPVTPMPLTALPVTQRSFDGTPILDDKAMLTKWLTGRAANPASQVALYYNSISLHDGNRMEGSQDNMHSLESFKPRLSKLLDDIDDFLVQLEKSGRRAVVVMVPEHGAAVRGDKMQIAGLREMPSRAITLVPVGIRVIGPEIRRSGDSVRTDATTSYLAVSKIVANMLEVSPFKDAFHPADYLKDLPHTRFVAQNADVIVMQSGDRDYIKQGKEKWTEYKAGQ